MMKLYTYHRYHEAECYMYAQEILTLVSHRIELLHFNIIKLYQMFGSWLHEAKIISGACIWARDWQNVPYSIIIENGENKEILTQFFSFIFC